MTIFQRLSVGSRNTFGSRNPAGDPGGGAAITGFPGYGVNVTPSVLVAMPTVSGVAPGCAAVSVKIVYTNVSTPLSSTALPLNAPLRSPGAAGGGGASATGRLRQCTPSGLSACAQCIGPHFGATGLNWENRWWRPFHWISPLGSLIQPWYGV